MVARLLLLLAGLLAGYGAGRWLARSATTSDLSATVNTVYLMMAGLLVAFLLGPRVERLTGAALARVEGWFLRLEPRRVAAATVGLIIALLLGVLLSSLLAGAPFYTWYVNAFVTLGLAGFFVYFASHNAQAFGSLGWAAPSRKRTGAKVLDTNVIIDGRVVELARTGFLEGEIVVPAFVLQELQVLADHGDPQRRTRGKRGLTVLEELRTVVPLVVSEWNTADAQTVDDKLVRFVRETGGKLVTNDANLRKVAQLYGLSVLSVHDIALALRPRLQAGETLEVTVTKGGQQAGQGVGYLDDGTMIVVEDGLKYRGSTVRVMVLSHVQTSVGRMVFARPEAEQSVPG